MKKATWLSIGENCLTSDLLRRSGLFAPSTIYSHARCTINHVLQIEMGGYRDLLNRDFLIRGKTYGGEDCTFSTIIKDGNLPFEFTHLNPLKIINRALLQSRIEKMLKARNSQERKIFCYHYRSSEGFNESFKHQLLVAITNLSGLYVNSSFFFFTQKVVEEQAERGFSIDCSNDHAFVEIRSLKKWEGKEDLYGRFDDDIFLNVLDKIKQSLLGTS